MKEFVLDKNGGGIELDSGKRLGPATLAYETYGKLNKNRDNAILVEHAFSGDADAASWWKGMIGKGRALDTDRYFIICSNVIGGCRGSTGPSSIDPDTKRPYGLNFPLITIGDMVRAQKKLIEHLGIEKLLCVIGGSMGGMQVLQWVSLYPDSLASAIPIATTLKHSPQQIAFDEVARQAIMSDPDWRGGDYYGKKAPERGLALARMIGHITYMSDESMEDKFSRTPKEKDESSYFSSDFQVEGYLRYKGDSFVKRFDANSYLYITKAMDHFDLSGTKLIPLDKIIDIKFLVIAFRSDWLYPPYQSKEIVKVLQGRSIYASYCEINSTYGHDAFLLEVEEQSRLISGFLAQVSAKKQGETAYEI